LFSHIGGHPINKGGIALNFLKYHGRSVAYNLLTHQWITNHPTDTRSNTTTKKKKQTRSSDSDDSDSSDDTSDSSSDENEEATIATTQQQQKHQSDDQQHSILPPPLPTMAAGTSRSRSTMTKHGLWIRAISEDNTFDCYNIHTRKHSILQMKEGKKPNTRYSRPHHLISLADGNILIITWFDDKDPLCQIMNPHSGVSYELILPSRDDGIFRYNDVSVIDAPHLGDHQQFLILGNGFIPWNSTYNMTYWYTIITLSLPSSSSGIHVSPVVSVGKWTQLLNPSLLPHGAYNLSLRAVL
jgi:hypothetical protein